MERTRRILEERAALKKAGGAGNEQDIFMVPLGVLTERKALS